MRVAEEHAEEYCKDGCYEAYPDESGEITIDISNEIKAAFIAGYMARNKEKTK